MKTYKIGESDSNALVCAIAELRSAKQVRNMADKQDKAAREVIKRELNRLRQVDVDLLPEGETVIVSVGVSGLKIDRRGSDRIDTAGLRALAPDVAEKFTKRTVASYFEPLA